jgi:hypothetical protein
VLGSGAVEAKEVKMHGSRITTWCSRIAAGLFALLVAALPSGPSLAAASPAAPSPTLASSPGTLGPFPPTACLPGTLPAQGSVATIAGTGTSGSSGDGGPATAAAINVAVGGLAVDASGAVYFTGYYGDGLRRISLDGVISTIVRSTPETPFMRPDGLDFDRSGNLYIADPTASRIWRLDTTGQLTSVAGTGGQGSQGDGGSAVDAQVHPFHVVVGPSGEVLFDNDGRFRVIDATGVIRAFAGTGQPGFAGDGGPAVDALMAGTVPSDDSYADVEGAAIAPDGTVYLADTGNQRIRKVDPDGIITTVAGNGARGYSGDGGPALAATFEDPVDLALDDAGNLYISDHHNSVVRKVDTSGVISTVAGTGQAGSPHDCGPATEATLQPWAIAVHHGYLYIADMSGNRIRAVVL